MRAIPSAGPMNESSTLYETRLKAPVTLWSLLRFLPSRRQVRRGSAAVQGSRHPAAANSPVWPQDADDRPPESPPGVKLVAQQPDATLAELGTWMDRPFRTSTMDLWLRRLGLISYPRCTPPNRTGPDVAENERTGMSYWPGNLQRGWCSSMKAEPTPA